LYRLIPAAAASLKFGTFLGSRAFTDAQEFDATTLYFTSRTAFCPPGISVLDAGLSTCALRVVRRTEAGVGLVIQYLGVRRPDELMDKPEA
jgi:hypothetical protein